MPSLKKVLFRSRRYLRAIKKSLKGFFFRPGVDFISRIRIRNVVLTISTPCLILALYYLISFVKISSAELCLESLKLSFSQEEICRGDCALNRWENKKCLLEKISTNKSLEKKIFAYLEREDLSLDFRRELVDIFRLSYEDKVIPDFLLAYLENSKTNEKLRAEIFKSFNWELEGENPLAYYLALIDSEASLELRLAAALKISSHENKIKAFSLADLDSLRKVIFNTQTPVYLRQSLVLLLGDYRRYFPQESEALLAEINEHSFKSDNLSRAFAADFIGLELPEISQEEWNNYYNH